MRVAFNQPHLNKFCHQARSIASAAASFRLAAVLATGMAAASLLLPATPAFGQTASTTSQKQQLSCVAEGHRFVCDLQESGQVSQTLNFEQNPEVEGASETVELTLVQRTALFNPELDESLANGLLWTFYLSLPIAVIVAIWRYDQRDREQRIKLVQQVATLERIWQHPQVR